MTPQLGQWCHLHKSLTAIHVLAGAGRVDNGYDTPGCFLHVSLTRLGTYYLLYMMHASRTESAEIPSNACFLVVE